MAVNIKWGKNKYSDVEMDVSQPPYVFKLQMFSLTGVSPDKQKIMIKGKVLEVMIDYQEIKRVPCLQPTFIFKILSASFVARGPGFDGSCCF